MDHNFGGSIFLQVVCPVHHFQSPESNSAMKTSAICSPRRFALLQNRSRQWSNWKTSPDLLVRALTITAANFSRTLAVWAMKQNGGCSMLLGLASRSFVRDSSW